MIVSKDGIVLNLDKSHEIKITYFQSDSKKRGGKYVTVVTSVKKIDEYNRVLVLNYVIISLKLIYY